MGKIKLVLYYVLVFLSSSAAAGCPSLSVPLTTVQTNWHFHVSPMPIYHHRARKYCTDLSMDLAPVGTSDDYFALEEYLGKYPTDMPQHVEPNERIVAIYGTSSVRCQNSSQYLVTHCVLVTVPATCLPCTQSVHIIS